MGPSAPPDPTFCNRRVCGQGVVEPGGVPRASIKSLEREEDAAQRARRPHQWCGGNAGHCAAPQQPLPWTFCTRCGAASTTAGPLVASAAHSLCISTESILLPMGVCALLHRCPICPPPERGFPRSPTGVASSERTPAAGQPSAEWCSRGLGRGARGEGCAVEVGWPGRAAQSPRPPAAACPQCADQWTNSPGVPWPFWRGSSGGARGYKGETPGRVCAHLRCVSTATPPPTTPTPNTHTHTFSHPRPPTHPIPEPIRAPSFPPPPPPGPPQDEYHFQRRLPVRGEGRGRVQRLRKGTAGGVRRGFEGC